MVDIVNKKKNILLKFRALLKTTKNIGNSC